MQVKFTLIFRNVTRYYDSYDEAMKMAKFVGASIKDIKEFHLY